MARRSASQICETVVPRLKSRARPTFLGSLPGATPHSAKRNHNHWHARIAFVMATRKSSSKKSTSSAGKSSGSRKTTASAKKTSSGSKTTRGTARKTSKRTLIEPTKGDRRYVRRNKKGEFKTQVNVGRSLAADRRAKSKTKVAKGQGDRGDTGSITGGITGGITGMIRKVLGGK